MRVERGELIVAHLCTCVVFRKTDDNPPRVKASANHVNYLATHGNSCIIADDTPVPGSSRQACHLIHTCQVCEICACQPAASAGSDRF